MAKNPAPPQAHDFVIRPAEYIGSFLVSGSSHEERILAVRQQLARMRVVVHSQPVLLGVCTSGIKVFDETGQFVYMAHALRRISYATCCPEYCQIAFLAREPQQHSSLQYCHAFVTPSLAEAENVNNIVGDAFKLAYAKQQGVSPLPTFREFVETQSRLRQQQQQQVLMQQQQQQQQQHRAGPEVAVKMQQLQRSCSSDLPQLQSPSKVLTQSQPPQPHPLSQSISCNPSPAQHAPLPPLPAPEVPISRSFLAQSVVSSSASGTSLHQPLMMSALAGDSSRSSCILSEDDSGVGTGLTQAAAAAAGKKHQNCPLPPIPSSQQQQVDESLAQNAEMSSRISSPALSACYSQGVASRATNSQSLFHPQQFRGSNPAIPPPPPPTTNINEAWYQPNMARDEVLDYLQHAEMGTFLIRDSVSHPGAYALSVRVPTAAAISHLLVMKTSRGVRIKGLEKEWPSLHSMVIHLSVMPEMLPCPLRLPSPSERGDGFLAKSHSSSSDGQKPSDSPTGLNRSGDASSTTQEVEEDEDYQKLCDFSRLMNRLKATQISSAN